MRTVGGTASNGKVSEVQPLFVMALIVQLNGPARSKHQGWWGYRSRAVVQVPRGRVLQVGAEEAEHGFDPIVGTAGLDHGVVVEGDVVGAGS